MTHDLFKKDWGKIRGYFIERLRSEPIYQITPGEEEEDQDSKKNHNEKSNV